MQTITEKQTGPGIYKNEKQGTWSFRIVRDRNYKRTGFGSFEDAAKARTAFLNQLQNTGHPPKPQADLTLDEVFSLYITEGTLSSADGTIRKRKSVYWHHISPNFGNCRINSLTAGTVNLFLERCYLFGDPADKSADPCAYGYVESFLKCFYAIIGFAYRRGLTDRGHYNELLKDDATRIRMPGMKDEDILKKRKGVRVFTQSEIGRMRSCLGDGPLRIAFELALGCGLRISEVFALTWDEIDLQKAELCVNKQLLYIGGEWCFCHPKYVSGYRTVFIGDYLAALLRIEKGKYGKRLKKGKSVAEHIADLRKTGSREERTIGNFLLTDENGKFYNPNAFKYSSTVFRKELGISDFTFHALRHTFCSELAAQNCPISELCRMAGHSSIETTMRYYINATDAGEKAARAALNRIAAERGDIPPEADKQV